MRRLTSLLLAATLAVSVGAPVVSAQEPIRYTSTSSTLSFVLPVGWELRPIENPLEPPIIEAASAVLPSETRSASIVVTQLNADISGMPVEEYQALLDAVVANSGRGQLVGSQIVRIPAVGSASGEWVGVLHTLLVHRDGVDYEHISYYIPIADREYTVNATGLTGTHLASSETVGFIAASLIP